MNHREGLAANFRFAFAGLGHALRTQRTFRLQVILALIVVGLALVLRIPSIQTAVLVLAIVAVLAAELFNTTVEVLVDLISPEFHPKAKIAKDIAASGVLILAIGVAIVGILLLGPPLLHRLSAFFYSSVP